MPRARSITASSGRFMPPSWRRSRGITRRSRRRLGAPPRSRPVSPLPSRRGWNLFPPLKPVLPSKLVARAAAEMPAGEPFAPTRIAAEVNRRYSRELRKPIDSRLASTALRRLMLRGVIRLVRKGTAHRETIYARD